jgi:hypothetical protein
LMWMILIVLVAAGLGLSRLSEARARIIIVPATLLVIAYEALSSGLL